MPRGKISNCGTYATQGENVYFMFHCYAFKGIIYSFFCILTLLITHNSYFTEIPASVDIIIVHKMGLCATSLTHCTANATSFCLQPNRRSVERERDLIRLLCDLKGLNGNLLFSKFLLRFRSQSVMHVKTHVLDAVAWDETDVTDPKRNSHSCQGQIQCALFQAFTAKFHTQ